MRLADIDATFAPVDVEEGDFSLQFGHMYQPMRRS